MKPLELEIRCPECGGFVLWAEKQLTGICEYCSSLLYFEPDLEHRFYVEPIVRSAEDARQVLIVARAEKKRAAIAGACAPGDDSDSPRLITAMDIPLAPILKEFDSRIVIRKAAMLYAPYWHLYGTLLQTLLTVSPRGVKEYRFGRVAVDQALPAYDPEQWNFRDRGLRFRETRFREVTTDLLASSPHIRFSRDTSIEFGRTLRAHLPVEAGSHDTFKHNVLCHQQKMPVLRPYWIVQFDCDGEETVLIDGTFGTIAGYPQGKEVDVLLAYREKPLAVASTPALKVLSSRCPVCGVDTRWNRSETIHFCANCGRALLLRSGEIRVQPYSFRDAPGGDCLYIPFWKYRTHLKYQGKQYEHLRDFFRLFFQDRWLKGRAFSRYLWIPAVRIRQASQGDRLLSALIAAASSAEWKETDGPLQPPPAIRFGELDAVAASEMLSSALPVAAGVSPVVQKSGNLTRMLRETVIQFDHVQLVLVPFERRGTDLIIDGKPHAIALLEGDHFRV